MPFATPIRVRRLAALVGTLLTVAGLGPGDSAMPNEAARALCGYVEARNRNEFRSASALSDPDIRLS